MLGHLLQRQLFLGNKNSVHIGLTVKAVNSLLSQVASDSSINSLVFVSLVLQEVLQQVQHFGHLGED